MTVLPLSGIRVIDFTQVMLGPCCTQVLADYGAEVIKIEKEGTGDISRWSLGADPDGLNNPVFASLNRNKKSVTADVKTAEGMAKVLRLLDDADVVVSNFRPGVMERMGLGYDALKARNPRIIFAIGTGFGLEGPNVHKGGQDILAQAMSGVMDRTSDPDVPMTIYSTSLCDYTAGMHLVQGILLALMQRDKTGEGQTVSVSLYSSMLAMQMQEAAAWMMRKRDLNWARFPLTGVYQTATRPIVMVGAFKKNPLQDICHALELDDLSLEERYKDFDAQLAHRSELQAIFRKRLAERDAAHWLQRLEGVDILCAPVRTMAEALDDEQTAANRMIIDAGRTAAGPVRLIASPIDMSGAPLSIRQGPPRLGEHNEEVFGLAAPAGESVA